MPAARSGSSTKGSSALSGRHAGVNTMPGSTSSKPAKKRASWAREMSNDYYYLNQSSCY